MSSLAADGRLAAIRALAKETDTVCVSFSGGKDSLAVLSLCKKFIPNVSAAFLYKFPGLKFEQDYFARVEDHFKMKILTFPSASLLRHLSSGAYGADTVAGVSNIDRFSWFKGDSKTTNAMMRRATGAPWTAVGIKRYDSLVRYTTIYKQFGHMNQKGKISYPVITWKDRDVWAYLRRERLPINPLYAATGRSFGSLNAKSLEAIRTLFPADYAKIKALFPHIDVAVIRGGYIEQIKTDRRGQLAAARKAAKASELRDREAQPEHNPEGSLQPESHHASS